MCAKYTAQELCSPMYTQASHRVLCPAHNTSIIINVTQGGTRPLVWSRTPAENKDDELYHNLYQGCFCDDGQYKIDHRTESYLSDSANFIYQYVWENPILAEQSVAGDTRLHIQIETCRECEAGWACQQSSRRQCLEVSSSSTPGSTFCTCRPGFVRIDHTTCGPCPLNNICLGGSEPAQQCSSVAFSPRNGKTQFCPCPPGSILDAISRECTTCSVGFFCPGFENMTGVVPSDTIYARRCPINSTSVAASQTILSCFCAKGFFIPAFPAIPRCMPCHAGHYYPGTGGPPRACPQYTTTTTSLTPATAVSDCVCVNLEMQLHLNQSCVCRAGYLQLRYVCVFVNMSCPVTHVSLAETDCVVLTAFCGAQ